MQTPPDAPQALKRLAVFVAFGLVVVPIVWLYLSLQGAQSAIAAGAVREPDARTKPPETAASTAGPDPAHPPKPEPAWRAPATPAERQVAQARTLELTDPARARALLREALALEKDNERALRSLAAKLLVDERHAEAARLSERCLALNPTNSVCRQVRAQAAPFDAKQEVGQRATEECLRKDPKSLPCLYGRLNFALTGGKLDVARDARDELARLSSDSPLTHMASGRIEASQGHYAEARVLFELACQLEVTQGCLRAELLRAEGF
jgi:predicted Zn-dependent protease